MYCTRTVNLCITGATPGPGAANYQSLGRCLPTSRARKSPNTPWHLGERRILNSMCLPLGKGEPGEERFYRPKESASLPSMSSCPAFPFQEIGSYYGYGDAAVPYGGTGDGGSFGQSSRGIQHAARSTQHRSESPYLRKIRCSTIQYIVNGQMQMHRDDRTGSWRVDVVGLDVNTTTDVARRRETFLGFIALAHIFPCRSARDRLHCVCSTCCNVHSGLYSNYRVSVQ